MTAWEKARDMVSSCLPLLPVGRELQIGRYEFDGRNEYFLCRIYEKPEDEHPSKIVSANFCPESAPGKESFVALRLTEIATRRTVFLLEDMLYDEPLIFNSAFPACYYQWKKDSSSGRGLLTFFRIDFSNDDFINYEGNDLRVSLKVGNEKIFSNLPETLADTLTLLGEPIPHVINFEVSSLTALNRSELEAFSRTCHAIHS